MSNFLSEPMLYFLLFLHCLIGGIGALVAFQKGKDRLNWLILGVLGGLVTFLIALTLKEDY